MPGYTVTVQGEHGCTVTRDLEGANAQAACYLASRPAGVVHITYSEACGHCRGAGRVWKKRKLLSWKPCPVCGGAPETHPEEHIATVTN